MRGLRAGSVSGQSDSRWANLDVILERSDAVRVAERPLSVVDMARLICCLASVIADDDVGSLLLFDRMLGRAAAAEADDRAFEFRLTDNGDFIVNATANGGGEITAAVTTMMDAISKLLLLAGALLLLVANLMVKM